MATRHGQVVQQPEEVANRVIMVLEDLQRDIKQAPELLEQTMQGFFQQNAERFDYGELFEPLYLDLSEYVTRRGKRIRPMLFLLAYRIFGGDRPIDNPALLNASISQELLHAFILMHDDVIDRSERRRGLPTFHRQVEEHLGLLEGRERVGQNVALVVGDMLFALAIDTLHRTDFDPERRANAISRCLQYVSDTGAGEIYDILLGVRDVARVPTEDIAQMYTLKTTRYTFEAPVVLGALLANASEDEISDISSVTDPLGLAFQIQNDLVEYSHFKIEDKSMQTDLLEGKKTMLMRIAYDLLSEMDRSFLQICLSSGQLNDSSILKIREIIERSGALEAVEAKIEILFAEAETALDNSCFSDDQKEGMRHAIKFVRGQTISTKR